MCNMTVNIVAIDEARQRNYRSGLPQFFPVPIPPLDFYNQLREKQTKIT